MLPRTSDTPETPRHSCQNGHDGSNLQDKASECLFGWSRLPLSSRARVPPLQLRKHNGLRGVRAADFSVLITAARRPLPSRLFVFFKMVAVPETPSRGDKQTRSAPFLRSPVGHQRRQSTMPKFTSFRTPLARLRNRPKERVSAIRSGERRSRSRLIGSLLLLRSTCLRENAETLFSSSIKISCGVASAPTNLPILALRYCTGGICQAASVWLSLEVVTKWVVLTHRMPFSGPCKHPFPSSGVAAGHMRRTLGKPRQTRGTLLAVHKKVFARGR